MSRMMQGQEPGGSWDLEAFEMGLRESVHRLGAVVVEKLLEAEGGGYRGTQVGCGCGGGARFMGYRAKALMTVLGSVSLSRAYYWCRHCGEGQIPLDQQLDVVGTGLSPGSRRLAARVGAKEPYREAAEDLKELAGVQIGAKAVERISKEVGVQMEALREQEEAAIWQGSYLSVSEPVSRLYVEMDGTGIPVVGAETEGRAGRRPQTPAKTREVKIGCVFTQSGLDSQGRPQRDSESTSYVAAIEGTEAFGRRLYAEAFKRGVQEAQEAVVLGDGAAWIWNLAGEHFPQATQIVDLYHAREHLYELRDLVPPEQLQDWLQRFEEGEIEEILTSLGAQKFSVAEDAELLRQQIVYFENNAERMDYARLRSRGLFVGSGVVEAACRTVIAQRLKRSGMFWSLPGANQVLALRTNLKSGHWENFWESRTLN